VFEISDLSNVWEKVWTWLTDKVLVTHTLIEVLVVIVAFGLAWIAAPRLATVVTKVMSRIPEARRKRPERIVGGVVFPALWLVFLLLALLVTEALKLPDDAIAVVANLIGAWVVIRLFTIFLRTPVWARFFAVTAWCVAALNILDLLPAFLAAMDGFAVTMGGLRISALSVVKSLLTLVLLLWAANFLSRVISRRVASLPSLTPSVQVLTTNLAKILFVTIAVVAALSTLGIDLTAFAVFSGAVGVGVGFGLQKIVSNLVSGIIILVDKSVKPGDVIAIGGTYGWINSLNARYASVITRDGIEHLIPNEELITQRVENWSYSNNLVRQRAPVGVSYKSDIRKAMQLCLEAVGEVERILKDPPPICLLTGFGNSSVDLELRFWISDPSNGVSNVKSQVYLLIWDKFHEHDIEIPFPQRDLHIRSPEVLSVSRRDIHGDGDGTPPQA